MTYPGSAAPILPARRNRASRAPDRLVLDPATLRSFGTLNVPLHLWRALSRFATWIEPALVTEWQRLMEDYAERQDRSLDPGALALAMRWDDPKRDTQLVRGIALDRLESGGLRCVWTGRRLTAERLDIDHCLPWSAWPCNDLWNLMPCDRQVNQNSKREKLPSARLLIGRADAIQSWWQSGYVTLGPVSADRFYVEARILSACRHRAISRHRGGVRGAAYEARHHPRRHRGGGMGRMTTVNWTTTPLRIVCSEIHPSPSAYPPRHFHGDPP